MISMTGSRILSRGVKKIKTSIKEDISDFQERSEQESEVYQIEHKDVEEDQLAENLITNLNVEDMSNGDQIIDQENKSVVRVFSQEDLAIDIPHIDIIFGDEWRIVKNCDLMVQIPHTKCLRA